jgi:hypothetical protein
MTLVDVIRQRFEILSPFLNERTRRLVAAAETKGLLRGGVSLVSQATGVSRRAIGLGLQELASPNSLAFDRVRHAGAGRKKTVHTDVTLRRDLECLIEPVIRGDPMSPLRWTAKSVRKLSAELNSQGHNTSRHVVSELLHEMGYSLQANKKTTEGGKHPDRNAQFEHINEKVKAFIADGAPVISVDTKKKELVGDFKNGGRELRPVGEPEEVRVHDFPIKGKGKVAPYGVYDLARNDAWVSVGIDHDTAAFAVETIRRWWASMGCKVYAQAQRLLITADGGGSNGSRVRLWKTELQKFADETQLNVSVCHLPPGTSEWNKIEHRLFSFITQNWRGKPLVSHEVIVSLIAATTTKKGLKVQCAVDMNFYPKGVKVSKQDLQTLNLVPDAFHGDWNYEIKPRHNAQV